MVNNNPSCVQRKASLTANTRVSKSDLPQATSQEWRWVLIVGLGLLVVISLPFLWALWVSMTSNYTFMGLLSNPIDGATYLSKIQLGREGIWQTRFRHSPGVTEGAYLTLLYNGLGQISRFLPLGNAVTYHIARVMAGILMTFALYQFGVSVWQKESNRRLFFLMVLLGSGLGWLVSFLGLQTPDLFIPEAFPLYSMATNVQFPLAIAMLALMAGVVIRAFRPGTKDDPHAGNGGLTLLLGSLVLSLIAPHALVPFVLGFAAMIAVEWITKRRVLLWQFRWLMMVVLPTLPAAGYYVAELRYNPVVAQWNAQNINLSPALPVYLLGFGLPLIIALPGIYRAVRRYEADGNRFMLWWLVSILVAVYLPLSAQRRFSIGIMLPIAYFAVRGLQDFWLMRVPQRRQRAALSAIYGFSALTYLFLLLGWFVAANNTTDPRIYVENDYTRTFEWLDRRAAPGSVTLASEEVGAWLPGKAGVSVVYGHPYETLNAERNRAAVQDWYSSEDAAPLCQRTLERYRVRYILVGPQERALSEGALGCLDDLTEVEQFGEVTIYAP